MVEVFKTNVQSPHTAQSIVKKLAAQFPNHQINFDLADCDKILRIQGSQFSVPKIIALLSAHNHHCEVLPD